MTRVKSRTAVFAGVVGLSLLVAVVTVVWAVAGGGSGTAAAPGGRPAPAGAPGSATPGEATGGTIPAHSAVVVQRLDRSKPSSWQQVAWTDAAHPGAGTAGLGRLRCQRVHFAAGRGLCLAAGRLPNTFAVRVFDASFHVRSTFRGGGLANRARVSPTGHYGATTAFALGHSYAQPGRFSTSTVMYDLRRGRRVGDLETDFTTYRDGKRLHAVDENVWGVTFAADDETFYATVGTGGRTYLVRGSIARKRLDTVRANAECPSLSPDGTKVGFKERGGTATGVWRFHVLDLATGKDTPLAEPESVDDQLEWLDDGHLLYGKGEQVWTVPADGTGRARLFLAGASSPAVVR